jgi:glycosyltransferase involved in cell wall biosynthesis
MAGGKVSVVFIHSSNEMYGADRILLQVLETLPEAQRRRAVVWLPNDISPATFSLDAELALRGIRFEIRQLPILRRRYLTPRYVPRMLRALAQFIRDLRRLAPQTVYLTTSASLAMGIVARLLGVKRVVFHCQEVWHGREAYLLGALAMATTHCLCVSQATQRSLKGPVRNRARVMLNAIPDWDRKLVSPLPRGSNLTFLVASRWNSWKGHGTLLKAWDAGPPLGKLIVVGGPPEVGQAVDLPGLVAEMRNRDTVVVKGEVRDISLLIDESDFVVIPSDEPEPFGLVAIEAFARGRAVIASDGGGLAEIVDSGQTGELFPMRDAVELRLVMQHLDRNRAAVMGASAREAYLRAYSLEAFNERFGDFWNEILPGGRCGGVRS